MKQVAKAPRTNTASKSKEDSIGRKRKVTADLVVLTVLLYRDLGGSAVYEESSGNNDHFVSLSGS